MVILQISTFGWLLRSATLWPAVFGILIAGFGHLLFHSPESEIEFGGDLPFTRSRFGRDAAGLFLGQEFTKLSSAETPPKPSEIVESVGSGLGTGLFSLFGTALPVYVASLALLRSWKRNPLLTTEPEGNSSTPISSQARVLG